jgi:hypothetical protein
MIEMDMNRYKMIGLIDDETIISCEIVDSDLDFTNILGFDLISENNNKLLGIGDGQELNELLESIHAEYSELFFSSDVGNKCLYFECLVGSKTDSKKRYLIKKLIYNLKTANCPICNSNLAVEPKGNRPVTVGGQPDVCERYLIYCPSCRGKIAEFGFTAISMLKSFYQKGKNVFISTKKIKIGPTGMEIEIESDFEPKYRC